MVLLGYKTEHDLTFKKLEPADVRHFAFVMTWFPLLGCLMKQASFQAINKVVKKIKYSVSISHVFQLKERSAR